MKKVVVCALLSLCLIGPPANSQNKADKRQAPVAAVPTKWEYSVLTREAVLKHGKDDLTAGLNALGDEGWELVTATIRPPTAVSYYFKRPKQAAPAAAAEPKARETTSVLRLKHAQAATLAKILDKLYGQKMGRIVPDDRTNSLVLLGTENQTSEVTALVNILDAEDERPKGKDEKK